MADIGMITAVTCPKCRRADQLEAVTGSNYDELIEEGPGWSDLSAYLCKRCNIRFQREGDHTPPLELMPWERYWEKASPDFMRDDPEEADHPLRERMFKEAEATRRYVFSETGGITRILDVGCGTGIDAPRFRHKGYSYYGVDPIPNFLDSAKQRHPNTSFRQARIWNLPFLDETFDIVWCKGVIQHLPPNTYPEALEEMWRVTRRLLMVTTNREFLKQTVFHRDRHGPFDVHYCWKEFEEALQHLGGHYKLVKGFVKDVEKARQRRLIHSLVIIYKDEDTWRWRQGK